MRTDYQNMAPSAETTKEINELLARLKKLHEEGGRITAADYSAMQATFEKLFENVPPDVKEKMMEELYLAYGIPGKPETIQKTRDAIDKFRADNPFMYRLFVESVAKLGGQPLLMDDGTDRSQLLLRALPECHPFIIHTNPSYVNIAKEQDEETVNEVDLPFQSCFFEIHQGFLAEFAHTDNTFNRGAGSRVGIVLGIMLIEVRPKIVEAFTMEIQFNAGGAGVTLCHLKSNSGDIKNYVQNILGALKYGTIGQEAGKKFKVKMGKKGDREYLKTYAPIHIVPKSIRAEQRAALGTTIDWSHRWEVRGHWRKVDDGTLGVDRAGERCAKGMTWVKNYVKGPDDKPLIRKTRVIDTDLFGNERDAS